MDYLAFEKRVSEHTILAYKTDLQQFAGYMQLHYASLDIEKIKQYHIKGWMALLSESKHSARTIHRKLSSLGSFFKFLHKMGAIEASPMIKIKKPKKEKRLAVFVRADKMDQVLTMAAGPQVPQNIAEWNQQLIIELLYQTGMRRAELLGLTVQNTDLQRKEIKVLGKGNKERIIPISATLAGLMQEYLSVRAEVATEECNQFFVLPSGKALYPKYIYNLVRDVLSKSSSLSKNSPHILRHTFATHLLNEGADINAIKELLGHSSLAATQIYTHNSIEKLKNVHQKAHPKS